VQDNLQIQRLTERFNRNAGQQPGLGHRGRGTVPLHEQPGTPGRRLSVGAGMYENNQALWPTADTQSMPAYLIEFVQIWKQIPVIVFSSTLER